MNYEQSEIEKIIDRALLKSQTVFGILTEAVKEAAAEICAAGYTKSPAQPIAEPAIKVVRLDFMKCNENEVIGMGSYGFEPYAAIVQKDGVVKHCLKRPIPGAQP